MNTYLTNNETTGVVTGVVSLAASLIAGLACIGPLVGIALGISGLGWLSSYSYLTLPASITSIILLLAAITIFSNRKSSCANRKKHLISRNFLIVTALVVVGINVFEYIIFPSIA